MLIMDARPQLEVKGINVDNLSPDGKVFFLEEGHKYYHADDIKGGAIVPFEESKHVFRSPTGILADFKEKFETERIARKYVIDHKLDINWEQLVSQWKRRDASPRKKAHYFTDMQSPCLTSGEWSNQRPPRQTL